MDKIELWRTRQRLGHGALRGVENRDVLHCADANSGLLGEFGDDRLHRHEVRRPDHSIDVRLPTAFAAAIVCSSIVAAWAKGAVPGTKLATVSPTLPCRNIRREKPDLDMTSSSPVLALCVDLWSDPVERAQPRESIKRLHAAESAEREQRKRFRCLNGAGNKQTYDLSFARGKIQKTSRNSGPTRHTTAMAHQDDLVQY